MLDVSRHAGVSKATVSRVLNGTGQVKESTRQAGLRIPQDVSLFGFDDAPGATWLEPGLSTVYLPIEDMIATAIDQAVRLANSEPVAPIPPFTGTLILRESVAAGPFFQRPA
ncbi:LacI family DNA-binding transcriptional regulator [Salmonella enterica subsp. enterica serovar Senftenberg]|nr:LacI family DNA-binding transcriptional regulator [Salmonella enterica subsp. enterica serovar Senftenberg]ECF4109702.1 LacI family DNA-binding transcriptional regulator [Salmonella enterica subsp. enterica serovar Senftenberg]ECJ7497499.1 LacI family DNA-binding transcriptional regulator [Salmonella enterica subsp. enterica serovar Senftenberg]EGK7038863.1 substrate-binding domain-containing protein [Salmonella enterica subsp. enterica serovar Senftenberg]EGL2227493.1 substrate-binding doma